MDHKKQQLLNSLKQFDTREENLVSFIVYTYFEKDPVLEKYFEVLLLNNVKSFNYSVEVSHLLGTAKWRKLLQLHKEEMHRFFIKKFSPKSLKHKKKPNQKLTSTVRHNYSDNKQLRTSSDVLFVDSLNGSASNYDFDGSDGEGDENANKLPEKKNRMGQRQRRA